MVRWLSGLSLVVLLACSVSHAPNSPEALKKQIGKMTQILESDDTKVIKAFMRDYAERRWLDEEFEAEADRAVGRFMKSGKQATLRRVLLHIVEQEPVVGDDKLTYTYRMTDDSIQAPSDQVVFVFDEDAQHFRLQN